MKIVPFHLHHHEPPAPWGDGVGVVYLMQCSRTGECKVGASVNPVTRLKQLKYTSRTKLGRELVYVWSIITNGIGRLEARWLERWEGYRLGDGLKEWFNLPASEIGFFRSFFLVNWKSLPPVPDFHREFLLPGTGLPSGWQKGTPRPRRETPEGNADG